MIKEYVPEATTVITQGGGGGNNYQQGGGSTHRGQIRVMLVPRDQRKRTNEQIAIALRRQLSGLPAWWCAPIPPAATTRSCGSSAAAAATTTAGSSRLQLEIRGHDLDDARRLAQDARVMMEDTPGIADVNVGREEGRPEIAVRIDRPKARMLGMSVASVATTIQTTLAGTTAAQFRERGNEYPCRRPVARAGSRSHRRRR
jgi:HAE1 family hydrophobic/amphiphilic exporter-1